MNILKPPYKREKMQPNGKAIGRLRVAHALEQSIAALKLRHKIKLKQ
jgi:hypothetical protein